MQKNNFEKQVQQKMEELKLVPSESVWQNVEVNIARDKRRKRGWILFPLLFASLCFGGYFIWHPGRHPLTDHPQILSEKPFSEKNKSRDKKNYLKKPIVEKSLSGSSQPNVHSIKSGTKNVKSGEASSQPIIKADNYKSKLLKIKNRNIPAVVYSLNNAQNPSAYLENNKKSTAESKVKSTSAIPGNMQDAKQGDKITPGQVVQLNNTLHENDGSFVKKITDSITQHELVKNDSTKNKKVNRLTLTAVKKLWSWGVTFSAGVSGVPNSFLGSLDKSYSYADALSSITSPQNNSTLLPSKIESSGAFVTGLFAKKNISKKASVTIGLNYKLFGSTNKVGVRNDSLTYRLDNAVNTYHNYYHFLELPVSLKIEISSRVIPLFWEGGVSLSQLISSNALQFNNYTGTYQKENSLFHKTQIGFNTGLSASFFSLLKSIITYRALYLLWHYQNCYRRFISKSTFYFHWIEVPNII